jgi:hypothetical protein
MVLVAGHFFVAGIAGLIAIDAPRLLPIDRRAFAAQQHVNAAKPSRVAQISLIRYSRSAAATCIDVEVSTSSARHAGQIDVSHVSPSLRLRLVLKLLQPQPLVREQGVHVFFQLKYLAWLIPAVAADIHNSPPLQLAKTDLRP